MRILVISQYFPPDITAASFRIYDTAQILAEEGHEVCVITAHPHRATVVGHDCEAPAPGPVRIRRSSVAGIKRGGFINYVSHYCSFMVGSIARGLKERLRGWKPDVIWASSPPLFVGLSGRMLSVFFRCPLVVDVRDIWPDSAVAAGQIVAGSTAYRIGKRMEKYVYRSARHITCVAAPMSRYIAAKANAPVSVVYNGVPCRFNGEPQKILDAPNEANQKKTILYAGNLGRVQQLDLLIRAYAELIGQGHLKDWVVRFVGAGALADDLKTLIVQLQLQDRVFVDPPVTRDVVMRKLQTSDLLFLSLLPDEVLKLTIPSKIFDYMLAGRPIVAGIGGEGKEILESTGANLCYCPGRMDDLKQALQKAASTCSELGASAHKNRSLVLGKYTRQASVSRLIDLLGNLC